MWGAGGNRVQKSCCCYQRTRFGSCESFTAPCLPPSRLNLCDEKLVLTAVTRDVCYMFLRIVYCRGRSQMH